MKKPYLISCDCKKKWSGWECEKCESFNSAAFLECVQCGHKILLELKKDFREQIYRGNLQKNENVGKK